LKSILEIAQYEAKIWYLQGVELWNPTVYVQGLIEATKLEYKIVVREEESIASLMWYGPEKASDIDWVGNDKYGWC
jgi:hypothetical protein